MGIYIANDYLDIWALYSLQLLSVHVFMFMCSCVHARSSNNDIRSYNLVERLLVGTDDDVRPVVVHGDFILQVPVEIFH